MSAKPTRSVFQTRSHDTNVLRGALDGNVGPPKLALGPVAHRVDRCDSRNGCCDDGFRDGEDAGTIGSPRPYFVETDRNPDFYNRSNWTAVGHSARNRVWYLGGGVFVAWRSRLADRCLALFGRLYEHARRIRADAAATLAADGRSRGSRRDATVWCERGLHFRGDAGILVNARTHFLPQGLTREGSQRTMSALVISETTSNDARRFAFRQTEKYTSSSASSLRPI